MSVSLRSLPDSEILAEAQTLASRERCLTLRLLLHLNEIERRRLHLQQGYSSMFDYCTSGLGYSEPAAVRRIRTARCVARFPEVYDLLATHEVSLTTITRVSRILTPENKEAVFSRIRGRPLREVDGVVAEYRPRTARPDIVRPVVLQAAVSTLLADAPPMATPSLAFAPAPRVPAPRGACEEDVYRRSDGAAGSAHRDPTGPVMAERVPEKRVQFQFTTSEDFERKIERIKAVAWHRLPARPSLEHVFELAVDCFLERHDPCTRHARREQREETAESPGSRPRHVAIAVRDRVFARDEGRCTFVGANGRRCGSRNALQVDHVTPVARGGASTPDNLRILCAYHNRLEAERLLGSRGRRRGDLA